MARRLNCDKSLSYAVSLVTAVSPPPEVAAVFRGHFHGQAFQLDEFLSSDLKSSNIVGSATAAVFAGWISPARRRARKAAKGITSAADLGAPGVDGREVEGPLV